MKINQYACISLTQDYQKKGDIPDCKDQWIILNKAQCIKHKLQEYEPIVGPGKFDASNTDNQFINQTPNSSSIFTIINDKLLIAYKQKILQYDRISDLFSTDKYQVCQPQLIHQVTSGNVISLHPHQNQLIVRTDIAIILYKLNNSNFSLLKTYNYSNVKQLNIENNVLFLCLSDKLIGINLINLTEQILKIDNNIVAGYIRNSEYYFICENSNIVRSLLKTYELTIPNSISIKALFVINTFICVCGYETKYEPYDEEDEEPTTYSSHIFWYDITCNQPLKECGHLEIDLIADTNDKGDFGIKQISDLYIVYGSNLRIATFWKLNQLCQQAKRYENSDEKLELLQHQELRGLVTYKSNPFIGFGMNQKSFRCIERNPNICILDKKGGLLMYEFLNFQKIVEYQITTLQSTNSIFSNSLIKVNKSQILQKFWDDIKFTLIESLKKEFNTIANPPFNLSLTTQTKDSQMVFGYGKINYVFRLHQNQNPSANLVLKYKHFQIIGHEREIIILTPLIVQQILLEQQHQFQIQKITSNPSEIINSLFLFQNKILVQTNTSLYIVNQKESQWDVKLVLNQNNIKKVQVLDQFILLTILQDEMQQVLYEFKMESLQQKATHCGDAGCLFQLDGQIQLLLISDDQLYLLKDFLTKQLVQIDVQIKKSNEYCIAQLHDNHIYLSFATIADYEFNHYILNYDMERNQAKQEQHLNEILENFNINDFNTQIINFDWNITQIKTPKAKFVIIFPNGLQEGFIFQICGNDLRTIDNEKGDPIQLSSYTHHVKGISILDQVLPSEEKLGSNPGLCKAKQDQKEFQYQMQPSILIYEFDEKSNLTIHRLQLIKLELDDSTPLLQVYQEPPEIIKAVVNQKDNLNYPQKKTPDSKQEDSLKSVSNRQAEPPKKITQITLQLQEFCKQSFQQLNGEMDDALLMKPYFPIFTSQKVLDELSAHYTKLQNIRKIMKQKIRESSSVQEFCLLRKSFEIPKIRICYDKIQQSLTQLSKVEEQFSWICNFVISTLQMNPIKRNKITFGEFEFPSIHHITPQKQKPKTGRKIVFSEFCDQEPQADLQSSYIQKLCQANKSKVKYLKLNTESNKDMDDLHIPLPLMSTISFGQPYSKFLNQNQSNLVDEDQQNNQNHQSQIKKEPNRKNANFNFGQLTLDESDQNQEKKSEISSQYQFSDQQNKGLTRTKGGDLSQGSDKKLQQNRNRTQLDSASVGQVIMTESQLFDASKPKENTNKDTTKQSFGLSAQAIPFGQNLTFNLDQEQKTQKPVKKEEPKKQEGLSIFGSSSQDQPQLNLFGQINPSTTGISKDPKQDDKSNSQLQSTNNQKQKTQDKSQTGAAIFGQPIKKTEQPEVQQTQNSNQVPLFGQSIPSSSQNDNVADKQQQASSSSIFNGNTGNSIFAGFTQNIETSSSFLGIKNDIPKQEQQPLQQSLNSQQDSKNINQTQQKTENKEQNTNPKVRSQPQDIQEQTANSITINQPTQNLDQNLNPITANQVQVQTPAPAAAQTASSFFNFGQTDSTQAAQTTQKQSTIQNQPQAPPTQIPSSSLFTTAQQEMKFSSFQQNQSNSFFQNSNNQAFQGLQNAIGLPSQVNQSGGQLVLNSSSFGSQYSIFDQKSAPPPPQQKISFSNLQNQGLPNSIGGIFSQTPQVNIGGFIQTTSMNLGFDVNQEKPRK